MLASTPPVSLLVQLKCRLPDSPQVRSGSVTFLLATGIICTLTPIWNLKHPGVFICLMYLVGNSEVDRTIRQPFAGNYHSTGIPPDYRHSITMNPWNRAVKDNASVRLDQADDVERVHGLREPDLARPFVLLGGDEPVSRVENGLCMVFDPDSSLSEIVLFHSNDGAVGLRPNVQ